MAPVRLHVLIVDDCADDAELVSRTLRRGGYAPVCERVFTPDALAGALRAYDDWDIVLCDSVMPCLDVLRALSLVHGIKPRIPFLVVSGRYHGELREALAHGEVSGFLSKDRLDDLPALIRGLLATMH